MLDLCPSFTGRLEFSRRPLAALALALLAVGALAAAGESSADPLFAVRFPPLATGIYPQSVAIADLNGDGIADLVVANVGTPSAPGKTVSVLLGEGNMTFRPKTDYATGLEPFSVAIGDLNRDGKPDLAVANAGANTVSVLLG